MSGGSRASVIRVRAEGAMALEVTPQRAISIAVIVENAAIPNFAFRSC